MPQQWTPLIEASHSIFLFQNLNWDHTERFWVNPPNWQNYHPLFCSLYNENIFLYSVITAGNSDNDQTAEISTFSGEELRSSKGFQE